MSDKSDRISDTIRKMVDRLNQRLRASEQSYTALNNYAKGLERKLKQVYLIAFDMETTLDCNDRAAEDPVELIMFEKEIKELIELSK